MPNIKSAIKRVSVTRNKREDNRPLKSELATAIKKFKAEVNAGNLEGIDAKYSEVVSVIDSACSKNIIKKNNADRKKARLAIMLNKAKANANA